jgi:hypothetical protein
MKFLKNIGVITICITICLSFGSCSASKNTNNLKKVKTKHFEAQYPKDWKRFGLYGYIYLRPKAYNTEIINIELNNISLINKTIATTSQENYINILENHAKDLTSAEKKRTFNIVKLPASSPFFYRIDYYRTFTIFDGVFKRQEYFYITEDGLKYISAQFEKELFDVYEKEINSVVNSFKIRSR